MNIYTYLNVDSLYNIIICVLFINLIKFCILICKIFTHIIFLYIYRYIAWQNSSMVIPIKRTPKLFKLISSRCCKLFRKILEPNQERRPKNLNDVHKFLDDRWLAKGAEKDMLGKTYIYISKAIIIYIYIYYNRTFF